MPASGAVVRCCVYKQLLGLYLSLLEYPFRAVVIPTPELLKGLGHGVEQPKVQFFIYILHDLPLYISVAQLYCINNTPIAIQ